MSLILRPSFSKYIGLDLGRYSAKQSGAQHQKLAKKPKPPAMALRQPPKEASPAEDIELDIEAAAPVIIEEKRANSSIKAPAEASCKVL